MVYGVGKHKDEVNGFVPNQFKHRYLMVTIIFRKRKRKVQNERGEPTARLVAINILIENTVSH